MNIKKFLIASLVVFVTLQILDYVIHSLILMSAYESLQAVFRPDMMDKMWIFYLTGIIFSLLFVYIFSKGYEGKGVAEGAKYGLLIGLIVHLVGSYNQWREMLTIYYRRGSGDKIEIMTKKQMRKMGIKSPNRFDALMLSFFSESKSDNFSQDKKEEKEEPTLEEMEAKYARAKESIIGSIV